MGWGSKVREPDYFVWFDPHKWMHKDFRYPPSSREAVAMREAIKPGPDYVPNMRAEITRLTAENADLKARLTAQPL